MNVFWSRTQQRGQMFSVVQYSAVNWKKCETGKETVGFVFQRRTFGQSPYRPPLASLHLDMDSKKNYRCFLYFLKWRFSVFKVIYPICPDCICLSSTYLNPLSDFLYVKDSSDIFTRGVRSTRTACLRSLNTIQEAFLLSAVDFSRLFILFMVSGCT